jgi:hypothetical protein
MLQMETHPDTRTKMNVARTDHRLVRIEDYEQYVGSADVERILRKAEKLRGFRVVHVNSTYYGGGVATMLSPLTSLMNSVGIMTGWRVIQGSPDFFGITKKIHNALQGGEINLTDRSNSIWICSGRSRRSIACGPRTAWPISQIRGQDRGFARPADKKTDGNE